MPAPRVAILAALAILVPAATLAGTIGPRLRYLRHLVATSRIDPPPAAIAAALVVDESAALLPALPAGVVPRTDAGGRVLRTARVIPVRIETGALESLEALARLPGVDLVETGWFPRAPPPPLDLSRPEIGAPQVWPELDAAGVPLTGEGVAIGNLDTGIDVFHPHFFRADGGRFSWIDDDGSGDLTPGVDAVDLDGDGSADPGETIEVFETPFSLTFPDANPAGYDLDRDWLYADLDGDGARDFGPAAGFDDASPSFGEPLFFLDDQDGDGQADPGEELIGLGSSKVRALRQRDGTVRRRGVDLVLAEGDDYFPHGTWVAGILLGGVAGVSRMAGIAPGAELVLADLSYPSTPPFEDDLTSTLLWARSEGARVFQHENGNWVWAWLDGSSPNEVAVSDLAAAGYPQLTPTGNLTGGGQHETRDLAGGFFATLTATTPAGFGVTVVWPSILWRGDPADASVRLELPGGLFLDPCLCARTEAAGSYRVYSDAVPSPRGTTMLALEIRDAAGAEISGNWSFRLGPVRDLTVHAYSWDDQSGWSGVTTWSQANSRHTVTSPATADLSIAVGAYSPRDCPGCTPAGRLNDFSGRGARIDGAPLLDLAAPGSTVYSTGPRERSPGLGNISRFGGTSSALPHATGAAALLAQLNPGDSHGVIERLLREAALADDDTGPVPSDLWGMGKLRIRPAYEAALRPSLLRSDAVTALAPVTPPLATIFAVAGSPGEPTLTATGPDGFSLEGEGAAGLAGPGATDGDHFLAAHVTAGAADPEGAALVADAARPLVFYQLTRGALRLTKGPAGVTAWYQ